MQIALQVCPLPAIQDETQGPSPSPHGAHLSSRLGSSRSIWACEPRLALHDTAFQALLEGLRIGRAKSARIGGPETLIRVGYAFYTIMVQPFAETLSNPNVEFYGPNSSPTRRIPKPVPQCNSMGLCAQYRL
jgi:hypothetical protein